MPRRLRRPMWSFTERFCPVSKWLFIEPGRIGDWIVATVAVRLFAEKTGAEIDWAVRGDVLPLLDRTFSGSDAITIPDGLGLQVLPGLLSGVLANRKNYDGCCVLSEGRSGALVAAMTSAKIKCGYLGLLDPYNKEDHDIEGNKFTYDPHTEHLLIRTLRPLGKTVPEFNYMEMRGRSEFQPRFFLKREDEEKAEVLLNQCGIGLNDKFILISRGCRWRYKEWPEESWNELVKVFCGKGVHVLAVGSPSEYGILNAMKKTVSSFLFHVAGPVELPVYAALVQKSGVLVCHDSGPMHIASAVGANVVPLYGPTNPSVTGPLTDPGKMIIVQAEPRAGCCPCLVPSEDPLKGKPCSSETHECMSNIRVEQVVSAVEGFLL